MEKITRLYPLPVEEIPLVGAYLAHDLRQYSADRGNTFVFSNFIVSIDGRIAVPHQSGVGLEVPMDIANDRDWRLFQELAAQADIIISSGRYLRGWAEGRVQEILQVDDPRFADLRDWRKSRGLAPHPDIAIISGSLRFPIPDVLTAGGRKVIVFTVANPDPQRVGAIEAKGGKVIVAGQNSVNGLTLVEHLSELGYQTVYSSTGPKVLHLLLEAGVLDRLYLTHASRLLGGKTYSSIVEGSALNPPADLKIETIYCDSEGIDGLGQLFVSYKCT